MTGPPRSISPTIPQRLLSLEEAMEIIKEDELVEVAPQSIRLRKWILEGNKRP